MNTQVILLKDHKFTLERFQFAEGWVGGALTFMLDISFIKSIILSVTFRVTSTSGNVL